MAINPQVITSTTNFGANLSSHTLESLTRPDLGQANFGELEDEFKTMKSFGARMQHCNWTSVPILTQELFSDKYVNLANAIQQIKNFNLLADGSNINQGRVNCITNFSRAWAAFYITVAPHLCFAESVEAKSAGLEDLQRKGIDEIKTLKSELELKRNELELHISAADKRVTQAVTDVNSQTRRFLEDRIEDVKKDWNSYFNTVKKEIDSKLKEAETYQEKMLSSSSDRITTHLAKIESSTATQLKEALQKQEKEIADDKRRIDSLLSDIEGKAKNKEVSKQAIEFKGLAIDYLKLCGIWLVLSILAGAGLAYYVNYKLAFPPTDATGNPYVIMIESVLPRLITVTLLSTALVFCIRNYSANMHNYIVNRHRQKALSTFEIFVNATKDENTKNAVLIQSTQAIFAPQPSGYLNADADMPQVNQITEIIRSATKKDE